MTVICSLRLIKVSGKLNVNIWVSLGAKCWVRGGVGGQFPRHLNWSIPLITLLLFFLKGEDLREGNSPSWFNPVEAIQVTKYLQALRSSDKFSLSLSDIGVITPYRKQVHIFRILYLCVHHRWLPLVTRSKHWLRIRLRHLRKGNRVERSPVSRPRCPW